MITTVAASQASTIVPRRRYERSAKRARRRVIGGALLLLSPGRRSRSRPVPRAETLAGSPARRMAVPRSIEVRLAPPRRGRRFGPLGGAPCLLHRSAMESQQDRRQDQQDRLVERPRDRQQRDRGQPAQRPRDAAILDQQPGRPQRSGDQPARSSHGSQVRPPSLQAGNGVSTSRAPPAVAIATRPAAAAMPVDPKAGTMPDVTTVPSASRRAVTRSPGSCVAALWTQTRPSP